MTPTSPDENDAANRRAKKREVDRLAQRAARDRNRKRIALLEATIDALQKDSPGQRIAHLTKDLTDVKKERDYLADTVHSIRQLAQHNLPFDQDPMGVLHESSHLQSNKQRSTLKPVFPYAEVSSQPLDLISAMESIQNDQSPAPISFTQQPGPQIMSVSHSYLVDEDTLNLPFIPLPYLTDELIVPKPIDVCDCVLPAATIEATEPLNTSIWRTANQVLGSQDPLCESMLQLEDEMCEDIPIRVILQGWQDFHIESLPPLWQKLYETDNLQFQKCGDAERLGILIIMHRMLRYRTNPSMKYQFNLPPWLLSRPSQSLPHSPAIDFFVWPGVRERFVFLQHRYCSNQFWKIFAESFQISWPFEFRDCYKKNAITSQYSISPDFEERLQDINSWTMTVEFFSHFPEFYSDIPCSQDIPRLQLSSCYQSHQKSQPEIYHLAEASEHTSGDSQYTDLGNRNTFDCPGNYVDVPRIS
ncbi:hypothetical protein EDB81DRAFT_691369 [Dactylonectria macrodidyma]|uniref:BZIP transcription factor n=1 Tax=Dactylonectria macrodidyma TaxID=307937 RepID=A0A9P9ER18_9HYPO|nr:hypothetical protein EDB81DRAFT_691369 [Dactylonectria macrodidyma]